MIIVILIFYYCYFSFFECECERSCFSLYMCVFVGLFITYLLIVFLQRTLIILLFKLVKISLNSLDDSKSKITTAMFDNVVCCEYKCTAKDVR